MLIKGLTALDMKFKIFSVLILLPLIGFAGGKEIYIENCEKCHGFSRQGSLGLPLYRSTIANHPDSYLKNTIRHGRPGRVMPAFNLSDAQIAKLIRFLRAGKEAPVYPNEPVVGDPNAGEFLYQQYCLRCHGDQLQGGQGVGKNFSWQKDRVVSPPALANPGFLRSASDQMIKHIILNGIDDTEMMAFGKEFNFSDRMASDVVAYIRSFERKEALEKEVIDEPLSFVYESSKDLPATVDSLKNAAAAYNFRVYPARYLLEGLGEEPGDEKQVVVRFCNFKNMQTFLKIDPRLGVILPCRATVVETEEGQVLVIIENYKHAIRRFNNAEMNDAADELIEKMKEMVEESLW